MILFSVAVIVLLAAGVYLERLEWRHVIATLVLSLFGSFGIWQGWHSHLGVEVFLGTLAAALTIPIFGGNQRIMR